MGGSEKRGEGRGGQKDREGEGRGVRGEVMANEADYVLGRVVGRLKESDATEWIGFSHSQGNSAVAHHKLMDA